MNTREIAFNILVDVMVYDKFANLSLRELKTDLSEMNQAFVSELVYGTLQNYRYVRACWSRYSKGKTDKKIAVLLDMATYELKFMNSEDYAVLNEVGEIAKSYKNGFALGFVNAVLRQVSQNEFIAESNDIKYSINDWIYKMWISQYGLETADKIIESLNQKAISYLRINTLKTSKENILKDDKFTYINDDCVTYKDNFIRSEYFKDSLVLPQDYHSQRVTVLADVKQNEAVLDLCAAPGTKTAHTAAKMRNTGKIIAVDLYDKRIKITQEGLKKMGVKNTYTLVYDARKISEVLDEESFDTVLVDAPCSGLGVLRHKADIKIRIKPEDLDDLVKLQSEILKEAIKMVKKGGKIVYSTCTLNKKENEKQIEKVLANQQFDLVHEETMFPFIDNADGFYVAILKKKG